VTRPTFPTNRPFSLSTRYAALAIAFSRAGIVLQENRKRQAVHGSRDEEVLYIAKLTEHAITPTRGTPQSAGLDLYAAYDYVIPAKGAPFRIN
jgi:hypothetical protein